jgi:hypothetical protein
MGRALIIIVCLHISTLSYAQVKITGAAKIMVAPRIDGALDDAAWQSASIATGFITNTPVYGKPASGKTEVRVVYDNTAIYIGAYIYDDPANIRRQFTPRDNEQGADAD